MPEEYWKELKLVQPQRKPLLSNQHERRVFSRYSTAPAPLARGLFLFCYSLFNTPLAAAAATAVGEERRVMVGIRNRGDQAVGRRL